MRLMSEERTYDLGGGVFAILRIHQPSEPDGYWRGTPIAIRVWKRGHSGSSAVIRATEDEVCELEAMLGELSEVAFVDHPTLGKVVRG